MTVDLETTIDGAWREFRGALAEALDGLGEGDCVDVVLDPVEVLGGTVPGVWLCRTGDQLVLEVPSNRVLSPSLRLSAAGQRRLRQLGLTRQTRGDLAYRATYPVRHVDEAASVAVSALRAAFGVVHPAFLASDDFTWPTRWVPPSPPACAPATELAVMPADRADLDRLVDEALTPMIGHLPVRDADGDIPFPSGTAVVFVRTAREAPVVRVFAEMVVDIEDPDAAVSELAVLNRQIEGVKFTLHDDRIVASVDLPALPFVGEHLRTLVVRMCEVIGANDTLAARRVGGRTFLEADDESGERSDEPEDDLHPVMLRMLQLDAEGPGSLRPKDAAKLCGYDCDLILELIRWNEEQEIEWRRARDEAAAGHEYDTAEACEGERAHAQRTIKILRKALRLVLL